MLQLLFPSTVMYLAQAKLHSERHAVNTRQQSAKEGCLGSVASHSSRPRLHTSWRATASHWSRPRLHTSWRTTASHSPSARLLPTRFVARNHRPHLRRELLLVDADRTTPALVLAVHAVEVPHAQGAAGGTLRDGPLRVVGLCLPGQVRTEVDAADVEHLVRPARGPPLAVAVDPTLEQEARLQPWRDEVPVEILLLAPRPRLPEVGERLREGGGVGQ